MLNRRCCFILVTCCALAACNRNGGPAQSAQSAEPHKPTIELIGDEITKAFEVRGLDAADLAKLSKAEREPAQWTALFNVSVDNGKTGNPPPLLGSHRVSDGVLRFEPRFPLVPGVRYRAVFDPSQLSAQSGKDRKPIVAEFELPKPPAVATVLEHIYPSRNTLPENQLKFYLHFSAPMSRGEAYEHIHLIEASGKEIEAPFLELGEELWDPQGKRFTLFFDPGRIKRGLKPREDVGPALEEGKSYTLVIDGQWRDAAGNPLKESYRKTFKVGPPDDQPIDVKDWKLQPPLVGSSEPLTVIFPESLEHALLNRMLTVTEGDGKTVAGTVKVTHEETRWHFTPEQPWRAGAYHLVAQTTLEDLAGNNIGKPFEVDVFHPIQKKVEAERVKVPFHVQER